MYFVYLLYSPSTDHFYIGYTNNIQRRIVQHNEGMNISTRKGIPWRIVYYEAFIYEHDARMREKRLKHHARGLIELKKRITILERNGEGAVPR